MRVQRHSEGWRLWISFGFGDQASCTWSMYLVRYCITRLSEDKPERQPNQKFSSLRSSWNRHLPGPLPAFRVLSTILCTLCMHCTRILQEALKLPVLDYWSTSTLSTICSILFSFLPLAPYLVQVLVQHSTTTWALPVVNSSSYHVDF